MAALHREHEMQGTTAYAPEKREEAHVYGVRAQVRIAGISKEMSRLGNKGHFGT